MHADTYRFLKEGELFIPLIAESPEAFQEGYNAVVIELDGRLTSDLNWEESLTSAEAFPAVVWKLNLGLDIASFTFSDELPFRSFQLALSHFNEMVWPRFKEKTMGLIIYEGDADLEETFVWNEVLKESYEESTYPSMRLFCLSTLSEYLHQLIATLPDELLIFAQFDASSVTDPVEQAHLFSKDFFPHIIPAVKGGQLPQFGLRWQEGKTRGGFIGSGPLPDVAPYETTCGFVLPEAPDFGKVKEAIEKMMQPYRLIDELVLAESWDELEEIFVKEELLSPLGKRKLKAFEAAGGCVTNL